METTTTRRWAVHGTGGNADRTIGGRTLAEAIEGNFETVISGVRHRLGSAAGFAVDRVTVEYREGILGGKGGAEVSIWSHGLDLAHRTVSKEPHRTTVWIHARPEDLREAPPEET